VQVCSGCGLGVTHPFPEAEELQAINAETYPLDERVSTYLGKQNYFERRYRGYLQAIQRFVPTGRLLDVGCNLGLFLKVAIEHGYSVTGVEINEPCAVWGRTRWGLDVRAGALEDCGFGKGAFDVVTLFDVLEHVPNPRGLLRAVRPLLGGDGLLVLQSPNRESAMARMTGAKWYWLSPPDHLYHFSPRALMMLLAQEGFVIEHKKTWEPASEFAKNVLAAWRGMGPLPKLGASFLRRTGLPVALALLLQRLWWSRDAGGLIELYARKAPPPRADPAPHGRRDLENGRFPIPADPQA
jgi:SAM-dependent methyltransferase